MTQKKHTKKNTQKKHTQKWRKKIIILAHKWSHTERAAIVASIAYDIGLAVGAGVWLPVGSHVGLLVGGGIRWYPHSLHLLLLLLVTTRPNITHYYLPIFLSSFSSSYSLSVVVVVGHNDSK